MTPTEGVDFARRFSRSMSRTIRTITYYTGYAHVSYTISSAQRSYPLIRLVSILTGGASCRSTGACLPQMGRSSIATANPEVSIGNVPVRTCSVSLGLINKRTLNISSTYIRWFKVEQPLYRSLPSSPISVPPLPSCLLLFLPLS